MKIKKASGSFSIQKQVSVIFGLFSLSFALIQALRFNIVLETEGLSTFVINLSILVGGSLLFFITGFFNKLVLRIIQVLAIYIAGAYYVMVNKVQLYSGDIVIIISLILAVFYFSSKKHFVKLIFSTSLISTCVIHFFSPCFKISGVSYILPAIAIIALYHTVILAIMSQAFTLITSERDTLQTDVERYEPAARVTAYMSGLLHNIKKMDTIVSLSEVATQIAEKEGVSPELLNVLRDNATLTNEYSKQLDDLDSAISNIFKREHTKIELNDFARGIIKILEGKHLRLSGISLTMKSTNASLYVDIIPSEIHTAIEAIIDNSFDAMEKIGNTDSEIHIAITQNDNFGIITIQDHGPGIAQYHGSNVPIQYFELGKTEKQHGKGIGMWMAIPSIHINNGEIDIYSSPSGLSTAIKLPLFKED